MIVTSASINIAETGIFVDDLCNGQVSASIQTASPATIALDPTHQSTTTIAADGGISSVMYTVIHLPLELRNGDDGCNQPYLTTGYDTEKIVMFVGGRMQDISGITLHAAPQAVEFGGCLSLESPTLPCSGFDIPLEVQLSADIKVSLTFGTK